MKEQDFAFPQNFVRGLGAAPSHPIPPPASSPVGPHLVPQKKGAGDPHYYQEGQIWNERGRYWFAYTKPIKSAIGAWPGSHGQWVQNSASDPYIWYPLPVGVPGTICSSSTARFVPGIVSNTGDVIQTPPSVTHGKSAPPHWTGQLGANPADNVVDSVLLCHIVVWSTFEPRIWDDAKPKGKWTQTAPNYWVYEGHWKKYILNHLVPYGVAK